MIRQQPQIKKIKKWIFFRFSVLFFNSYNYRPLSITASSLIDEVERLREKLEDLKTLASQVRRPKVCTECKEIGNPRKVNIVKLSRVDAFAPTTVGQLNEGMMVKFIGTQRSDDISPVQEGQIEEIMRIDGEDVFVIRMSDDDGDSVFCQIPLRKIIVAWR